jgi:hypothetical protein
MGILVAVVFIFLFFIFLFFFILLLYCFIAFGSYHLCVVLCLVLLKTSNSIIFVNRKH